MVKKKPRESDAPTQLAKVRTGIDGFDDITFGGLPQGRPTLIAGSPGTGKTLFAVEFVVRGALEYGEPGVLVSFEETGEELAQNVAALGFDLDALVAAGQIVVEYVSVERHEIEETGAYDLEGLFIRLGYAIDSIGARRIALDTIEALFAGLSNQFILRAELRRLFRYLKTKGVTAVITGERGQDSITRQGLEEYVSDCVIVLDQRVEEQITTRFLRVLKYRGSRHSNDEYPFLIGARGLSVLPITSARLNYEVSDERISTGNAALDDMLAGKGFFRGSSILVTGTPGTGKTSLAASFVATACGRGERCLYFAFEESPNQVVRNMRSIGLDLSRWISRDLLRFHAARPSLQGLEMHLVSMIAAVREYGPSVVVVDPLSGLTTVGSRGAVHSVVIRLVDFLKSEGVTLLFTDLAPTGDHLELTEVGISSIIDTWIVLRDVETNGERNRGLFLLKSRGMAHSNQVREFVISSNGIQLLDAYLGPEGALTGAARVAQEAREREDAIVRRQETERVRRQLERRRRALEAQIALLREQFEAEEEDLARSIENSSLRETALAGDRSDMARMRQAAPRDESGASSGVKPTRRSK